VEGFGEYYGHRLADKNYGPLAAPVKNQKGEWVLSLGVRSSHAIYLERWDPGEPLDEEVYTKLGIFNDWEDVEQDQILRTSPPISDIVSGIKPKDFESAFLGKAPSVITAPEYWQDTKANLMAKFPLQQLALIDLFKAYNVN
jgi:hypothetical protein